MEETPTSKLRFWTNSPGLVLSMVTAAVIGTLYGWSVGIKFVMDGRTLSIIDDLPTAFRLAVGFGVGVGAVSALSVLGLYYAWTRLLRWGRPGKAEFFRAVDALESRPTPGSKPDCLLPDVRP